MSKVINMVGGGSPPSILASAVGTAWGNAERNFAFFIYGTNNGFFTAEDNQFVCQKAGAYKVQYYHQAVFNVSGNLINTILRVKVNGTTVQTSTTSGGVTSGEVTVTLSAGDIISVTNVGTPVSDLSRPSGAIITVA